MILELSSEMLSQLRNFPVSTQPGDAALSRFLSCFVSQSVSHVVSALQSTVFTFLVLFWLIGSPVDPTLAAFVVFLMRSLAVSRFSYFLFDGER